MNGLRFRLKELEQTWVKDFEWYNVRRRNEPCNRNSPEFRAFIDDYEAMYHLLNFSKIFVDELKQDMKSPDFESLLEDWRIHLKTMEQGVILGCRGQWSGPGYSEGQFFSMYGLA